MNNAINHAVLIGEDSLLSVCGDHLLSDGWAISAVVSNKPTVVDWAIKNRIETHQHLRTAVSELLPRNHFLFSISNFEIIPEKLLASFSGGAFNFHDAPLPDIAGVNAPVWSILNQKNEHGITWHRISSVIDGGQIICERRFPVDADETTYTLNTKCFEHAFDGFSELVDRINNNNLPAGEGLAPLEYFGANERPSSLLFANQQQDAVQIDRELRAGIANGYRNPLGNLKLRTKDGLVLLQSGEVKLNQSTTPATEHGVVKECSGKAVVATLDGGELHIHLVTTLSGTPVELDQCFQVGMNCLLSKEEMFAGTNVANRTTVNDRKWVKQLDSLKPQSLSVLCEPQDRLPARRWLSVSSPLKAKGLALALATVAARINDSDRSSILFGDANTIRKAQNSFGYYLPYHFSNIAILGKTSKRLLQTEEAIASLSQPAPTADLGVRFPAQAQQMQQLTSPVLSLFLLEAATTLDQQSYLEDNVSGDVICFNGTSEELKIFTDMSAESANRLKALLEKINASGQDVALEELSLLAEEDLAALDTINKTNQEISKQEAIPELFSSLSHAHPGRMALASGLKTVTYQALDELSNRIGNGLLANGLSAGHLIGVYAHKDIDTVAAMLAIMKIGAAYVPLDPSYPASRIEFIANDSQMKAVVVGAGLQPPQTGASALTIDTLLQTSGSESIKAQNFDLAYVIYTSGSTGKPKGVMVGHDNAQNFFVGIDGVVEQKEGTMLSVTSISFDISVLEIWWALTRGLSVVLQQDETENAGLSSSNLTAETLDFSLYYWNTEAGQNQEADSANAYKLLLEGAKYADENDFSAVWTPERHFGSFGGMYPNPSVTSAAIATITKRIHIRAGSCVLPLHTPIRVAEEWSVVDNLSNGRVGISFAAGWMPNDFVIRPENFENAKEKMFNDIEVVQQLWRGDTLNFEGPKGPVKVSTLPRPVQAVLPVWVTSAGTEASFQKAGKLGYNVLTHMLGQDIEALKANISSYNKARKDAGHVGQGTVTLMLHTYLANTREESMAVARDPMKNFLRASLSLVKEAAWDFPTFKEVSKDGKQDLDGYFANISDQDLDDLLEFAFQRYFSTAGLFGTVSDNYDFVESLQQIGVTELGCLIDFGISTDQVLAQLPDLNKLRQYFLASGESAALSWAANMKHYKPTHFQCTPSQANMLLLESDNRDLMAQLDYFLVGGEPINQKTSDELTSAVSCGKVINMYGPTETTVWSTTSELKHQQPVNIGRPIANTQVKVLDQSDRPCPVGVPGQLFIGGLGVTRGYLHRDELTKERYRILDGERFYATGDIVRLKQDGNLAFLNRNDSQVKLRGYRLELGDVESRLNAHTQIHEAVALINTNAAQLLAYYTADQPIDDAELKGFCAQSIPGFMVPNRFIQLVEMPHTPNGKIDRNRVPEAAQIKEPSTRVVVAPPKDKTERKVLDIWRELLELDEVDVSSNFFDVGGHSILAVRLQGRLREQFDISFPISALFQYPTVQSLAGYISSLDADQSMQSSEKLVGSKRAQKRRKMLKRD